MDSATGGQAWALVDAVQRLSLARTPEEVQDIVRTAARALCGADGATLVLREGDYCRYVDEDAVQPLWKGRRFPLETCISGWAMLNRQAVAIEDIYADERIPHDAYRPTFVTSLAMVPIRREQPVGAIGNYWAVPHAPSELEIALLQALADSTAVAMENVAVWAGLEDRVADRTAKLASALQLNELLLGTLAHEIRNALAASGGLLELALRATDDELGARTRELLKYASQATTDGARIVEDQLVAAKDRAGQLRPRSIDLDIAVFLEQLRGTYGALRCDSDVEVVVERGTHPTSMCTDPHLLLQALRNLMSNALKFTTAGSICLRADTVAPGWVAFTVTDSGQGIPAEDHERIFDDWAQGAQQTFLQGTGLGLPFVRRVALVLGGRVELVHSAPGEGSAFRLVVPDRSHIVEAPANGERATQTGKAIRASPHPASEPRAAVDRPGIGQAQHVPIA